MGQRRSRVKRLYGKRLKQKHPKPNFSVGDRARLNKIHGTFEKRVFVCGAWRGFQRCTQLQDSRVG